MGSKLTIKQEKFAKAYVTNDGNGVKAVEAAGYNTTDYMTKAAIASENLNKPKIAEAVQRERMKISEDPEFSPEALAYRLKRIADEAEADRERNVARQTLMDIAKLAGHLVDKTQDVSKLTDEQLQDELERLRKQG